MSDFNHLPRMPVRFVEENKELLKSLPAGDGQTDYQFSTAPEFITAQGSMPSQYRMPLDRFNGNEVFRRYMSGMLDFGYARDLCVDALHQLKSGIACSSIDFIVLSSLFPNVPEIAYACNQQGVFQSAALLAARIDPREAETVRQMVAAHIKAEINWNGGLGGGSVPGREVERL